MDLLDLRHKIEKIDSKIPNINYGGCGTFSYHLHKTLKDKYDIDSEIYYISGPPAGIDYDIKFSHILLKVEDYFIDNKGLYRVDKSSINPNNKLSTEKLKEMIGIKELWNNKFNVVYFDSNLQIKQISDDLIKLIYKI